MGILATFGGFMAMQFERRPDGYLYRANGKGPAWPVTEQEYARFVRTAGICCSLYSQRGGMRPGAGKTAGARVTLRCRSATALAGTTILQGGVPA